MAIKVFGETEAPAKKNGNNGNNGNNGSNGIAPHDTIHGLATKLGLTDTLPVPAAPGCDLPELADGESASWPKRGYRAQGVAKHVQDAKGVGAKGAQAIAALVQDARATTLEEVLEATDKHPKHATAVRDLFTTPVKDGGSTPWMHEALMFLYSLGLDRKQARNLAFELRGKTRVALVDDPYATLLNTAQIDWTTADPAAQRLGIAPDSVTRAQGAILNTLEKARQQGGHTYCNPPNTREGIKKCGVEYDKNTLAKAVKGLCEKNIIGLRGKQLFLKPLIVAEYTARRELERLTVKEPIEDVEATKWLNTDGMDDDQKDAAIGTLVSTVSVITGGPGVGKTYTVDRIAKATIKHYGESEEVEHADGTVEQRATVALCALAGRAARRMSEMSGLPAMTIHRLLGDGGKMPDLWCDNEPYKAGKVVEIAGHRYIALHDVEAGAADPLSNTLDWRQVPSTQPLKGVGRSKLPTRLLIVDETSMVDVVLAARVLAAVPTGCRVLFVGDVDQLPSIEAGRFMFDVMEHPRVNVHRLTHIHRQEGDSMIPVRAQEINNADPQIDEWTTQQARRDGFCILFAEDDERIAERIEKLVGGQLQKAYGVHSRDIQVLTAMHKGPIGTKNLNDNLRAQLNPPQRGQRNGYWLREGDRVMVTRNDYELGVMNGDLGTVIAVTPSYKAVRFSDGSTQNFGRKKERLLMLAYACTIHKSQGSEFPVVVVAVSHSQHVLLQRNLLYTAVTRARKACVIVARRGAVEKAVDNDQANLRRSGLGNLLRRIGEER